MPRPRSTTSSPCCVPGWTRTSTSLSKVGTRTLPPKTAVWNGIRASWYSCVPCLRNTSDEPTFIRTRRSPLEPFFVMGASPSPGTRMVIPSSTPVNQERGKRKEKKKKARPQISCPSRKAISTRLNSPAGTSILICFLYFIFPTPPQSLHSPPRGIVEPLP